MSNPLLGGDDDQIAYRSNNETGDTQSGPSQVTRRNALKTIATAGAGITGVGVLSGTASGEVMEPPGDDSGTDIKDSYLDVDKWYYHETGRPGEDADTHLNQEHSASLAYYGRSPNSSGDRWMHQFRMVGYTFARANRTHDDSYHLANEIREQHFTLDENQSKNDHGIFVSGDESQIGATPVADSSDQSNRDDWFDVAYSVASLALGRATYVGTAWSTAQLASALLGVLIDDGGGEDVSHTVNYQAWERPEQASYFMDFYVETAPGVDCKFTAESGATGETDLGVTFDVVEPSPDYIPNSNS